MEDNVNINDVIASWEFSLEGGLEKKTNQINELLDSSLSYDPRFAKLYLKVRVYSPNKECSELFDLFSVIDMLCKIQKT